MLFGNVDWQKHVVSLSNPKSFTFSISGTKTLKWRGACPESSRGIKNSSGSEGQDKGWVDGLVIGDGSLVGQPDAYSEALDCDLKFTSSGTEAPDTWYADLGSRAE